MTTIQTSLGCPYECIYCPAGFISDRRVKIRPVSSVVDEIELCLREFGVRYFLFNADTFTINKKWILDFCGEISSRNLRITWAANSRADTIDKEMLMAMRKAGCRILGFGVESGDDTMLQRMKKNITTKKLKEGISLCKGAGIRVHAFYIIGLPWETKETLQRTYEFAKEIDADFFDINIALPLPFTEFNEIAKREGLAERSIDGHGYRDSPVRTYTLSHADLIKARQGLLLRLYLRPKYIYRTLRRETESISQFFYFLNYGLRRLSNLIFYT